MTRLRIAALFDAENIGCDTAQSVMLRLRKLGDVQSACAVGDFSVFKQWIDCGRDSGINLVLQPSLGKGKNSADICLTIEAMDIAYRGQVDAIALVTHDRDFTPLAFRLRKAGMSVLGFGRIEPSKAFRAACSSFEIVGDVLPVAQAKSDQTTKSPTIQLSKAEIALASALLSKACVDGLLHPAHIRPAIANIAPDIAAKLSGTKKFLNTLVALGIVERVGAGTNLMLKMAA